MRMRIRYTLARRDSYMTRTVFWAVRVFFIDIRRKKCYTDGSMLILECKNAKSF